MSNQTDLPRLAARLRFRHLQLLDALDREGTLRRAAAVLHLSQPALSKALNELERMLELPLYERQPAGLSPTPAGRVLIRGARQLLDDALRVVQQARDEAQLRTLRVRLGVPPFMATTLVPEMLAQLTGAGFALAVEVHEHWGPSLIEAFNAGHVDVLLSAFRTPPASQAADPVAAIPVFDEQLVVIAPPGHPLGRRRRLGWAELADEPWVLPSEMGFLPYAVAACFTAAGVAPPVAHIQSPLAATNIAFVAAGLGLSVVPAHSLRGLAATGAVLRLRVEPVPRMPPVQLVHRDRPAIREAVARIHWALQRALAAERDAGGRRSRAGQSSSPYSERAASREIRPLRRSART
ncbi:MAG: LysR family transcriptional regulator [Burkholderiaceae bacterium]